MRYALVLVLLAVCPLAFADGKTDYSGVWKKNCDDEMGLHLKPLKDRQYAVLFCKSDFCSQPGSYRPNTRIEHDPLYEILSPTTLKVRYADGGFSVYRKCGAVSGNP
jgi:hypothetical protein